MVLNAAYALAAACLKERPSKFSRKDFTAPQLCACLVLREHQKKSYRGVAALLQDCPHCCADIGLKKVPDHSTLCRAHKNLLKPGLVEKMLDDHLASIKLQFDVLDRSHDEHADLASKVFDFSQTIRQQ
jgi:hypothetical protein